MSPITFVQPDGTERIVNVESGLSVMRTALANNIPGIVAECGGNAMCATCHVFVDSSQELPTIGDEEDGLLDCTATDRRTGSRLSCQIPALPGLRISVPEEQ